MRPHTVALAAAAWACGTVLFAPEASGASCEALTALELDHTEVTLAATVPAGGFEMPNVRGAQAFAALPAFCRVAATARPTGDSEIGLEVWLPERWNGKLQAVGNGGWAGSLSYGAMAGALAEGYATASTDTGHVGSNADFVPGHPDKLVDFGFRAIHEMTVAAKAVVAAYYEAAPDAAFFVGCSTGGRQALSEAQRYPEDYDGIVAGAPANHVTNLQAAQLWTGLVGHRTLDAALGAAELALVNEAALAACDTRDGVADGVIENPRQCDFDPASLICTASSDQACLSPAQAETMQRIYAGPRARDGASLFPGLARGSELGWESFIGPEPFALGVDTYRVLVFGDPDWRYDDFDIERDIATAQARIGPIMNSTDPDLEPFFARGGKLLLYHGWNDPGISPFNTIDYFTAVRATVPPSTSDDGLRLFMVPGMNHCAGGVGTDRFDAVGALDRWVATGAAPERIEARKESGGAVTRTRPLCAYPAVAAYDGSGDTDAAVNFVCRAP